MAAYNSESVHFRKTPAWTRGALHGLKMVAVAVGAVAGLLDDF
jgi:hypothetical protein